MLALGEPVGAFAFKLSLADSLLSGVGKGLLPPPDSDDPGLSGSAGAGELRQDDL